MTQGIAEAPRADVALDSPQVVLLVSGGTFWKEVVVGSEHQNDEANATEIEADF